MTTTELSKTYANQINASYQSLVGAATDVEKAVIHIANAARDVGLLLISAKEQVGHGRWQKWVSENLCFSETKAKRLMRISRAHPDIISDLGEAKRLLTDGAVASGNLDLPGREHAQTAKLYDFFSAFTRETCGVMDVFNRQIESEPLEDWPEKRRESVKEQLRPIAEVYARL